MRKQLLALLQGKGAHMTCEEAVADFPPTAFNVRPPHVPYTPWHLLEHIRMAQWDMLEFIRNPQHVSPPWPAGYWPAPDAQADERAWEQTLTAFRADLTCLQDLVRVLCRQENLPTAPRNKKDPFRYEERRVRSVI